MECGICVGLSDPEKNPAIICVGCGERACRECIQRYIGESSRADCMFCHREIDIIEMNEVLCPRFIDSVWRQKWTDHLFRREKMLFQSTMPLVRQRLRIRGMEERIERKKKELDELTAELSRMREEVIQPGGQFSIPCPAGGCLGYIDGAQCILCRIEVCLECMECRDDGINHVCRKEIIANRNVIKSTTRSCPGCRIPIYRISGCYQMWCTQCQTAFDWNTGESIKNEIIHNPHYTESRIIVGKQTSKLLTRMIHLLQYAQTDEMPRLHRLRREAGFQELRIAVMTGMMAVDEYRDCLYREDLRQQKYRYMMNMWNAFIRDGMRLVDEYRSNETDEAVLSYRLFFIIERLNEEITRVNQTFDCRDRRLVMLK